MLYREHPNIFQSLKWIQLIFSFVVLVLEMVQIGSNASLYDKLVDNMQYDIVSPFFTISIEKLFVYFAFLFSILSISTYLVKFKTIWFHKNGPFIWFEVSLWMLWFGESMINLKAISKTYGTIQSGLRNSTDNTPQEIFISFNSYIASVVVSSLIVILFSVTMFFAYKVNVEKTKFDTRKLRQQAKTHNIKVIKYFQNSERKSVTFIRNNDKDVKEQVIMCKEDFADARVDDKNDNEKFDNDNNADSKV